MAFHFCEKLPAAGSDVALHDGAAVNRNCRNAGRECTIEDRKELVAALRRIVETATHFYRNRNLRRHRIARPPNDLECNVGLAEMKAAAAAAENFLHRAAEIDVDHVKTRLDEL